eukprot:3111995-Prymnesium_polylepis.1
MASILPAAPCYQLYLIVNRHFTHRVLEKPALVRNMTAILCTSERSQAALRAARVHDRVYTMQMPAVTGVPNSLSHALKMVCDIHGPPGAHCASFAKLHITGVTFYEQGQQYVGGYQ